MTQFRVWYVNVFVADFNRAVDFYANKVGLVLKFRHDEFGYASFLTEGAGLAVAKVEPADVARLVGRHTGIGLAVRDIQAAYEEMVRRGVEFTMPPSKQPWGGILATFRDADGNVLYLDQLRDE